MKAKPLIGFIGQGWIGKSYADNFEHRGYKVVRFALEKPYDGNGDKIKKCDIVFIAVPTPTINERIDISIVQNVLKYVGKGKTAVIKSTILPGTTEKLQKKFPQIYVMHSPEFLVATRAAEDVANPKRNIVGVPKNTDKFIKKAEEVISVLPKAPFELVCQAREAEMIKYAGNCFLYTKVIFMNILYDLADSFDCDWDTLKSAIIADPRIGASHMDPHHEGYRGASGYCFPKDFAAFSSFYNEVVGDPAGNQVLDAIKEKNLDLLICCNQDLELLSSIYGKKEIEKRKKK